MSATGSRPSPDLRDRPTRHLRRYRRPRLDRLGDLRGLTLGVSPGIPDSGIGLPEQPQP